MTRLLLAEDQVDQLSLYHESLTNAGFEVIDAKSGHEAVEMFKLHRPEMVVLDIQMPGMDGLDALGKILAKDRQIPVLLHSAYSTCKCNFMTWAADAFVVKTGDATELVSSVRKLAQERGIAMPSDSECVGQLIDCYSRKFTGSGRLPRDTPAILKSELSTDHFSPGFVLEPRMVWPID